MRMKYADIIVDISSDNVDKPFEYVIPDQLYPEIKCGSQVVIPFGKGNRRIQGFVINIKDEPGYDPEKLKEIESVVPGSKTIESNMIELAAFIRMSYGSTMNRALRIVLPVKKSAAPQVSKYVVSDADRETLEAAIEKYGNSKKTVARYRLLKEIANEKILPYSIIREKLNIQPSTLNALQKEGLIRVDEKENLRKALKYIDQMPYAIKLNQKQQQISDDIWNRFMEGDMRPSLIRGITGSGKTEVYIDLIDRMIKKGRQAIMLIPEIALTYQTVIRFYRKFGDRISVINSRLTPAQKHDQLERARKGEVDIIIGPRSALFTPFKRLGIIIIDEEHEGTYRNEQTPSYHAREVAIKLAQLCSGIVVLGSATPSVESYYKAEQGAFRLYTLDQRAGTSVLPRVETIDLRKELMSGNRSVISRRLDMLIRDTLAKHEQIMLFINRRAYQSFVSCRNCGEAIKCPHCDVSLKYHKNGKLICHYCGFEMPMVTLCPCCGSRYIGTFGAGTQKVEEEVTKLYPDAAVLRMDMDTTKKKDGHEKILSAFANQEADILIGTQMIVKGHDFPNVTLVGILAADISLYSGNYMAAERTFQLITQAAGRAGRGEKQGNVIVQTYCPENYAISCGAKQDYITFYENEISYRKLLGYPPAMNMLGIMAASEDESLLDVTCERMAGIIDYIMSAGKADIIKIGPSTAPIAKIQDKYRKVIYVKSAGYESLVLVKDLIVQDSVLAAEKNVDITFDFSLNAT